MRFLVVGSVPEHGRTGNTELRSAFVALSREVGRQVAGQGDWLTLGSTRSTSADAHALAGYLEVARSAPGGTFSVRFHVRKGFSLDLPRDVPSHVDIDVSTYAEHPNDRRLGARLAAVVESDGVVCIGGSHGTAAFDQFAEIHGKPVVGLPQFGGTGEQIFHRIKHALDPSDRRALEAEANDSTRTLVASTAIHLLDQASPPAERPHSYFISYAHARQAEADHVELLLRRGDRLTLRDETDLSGGDRLDEGIAESIEAAETFVVVYSGEYRSSDYCMGELARASSLRKSGKRPSRIILSRLMARKPRSSKQRGSISTLRPANGGACGLEDDERRGPVVGGLRRSRRGAGADRRTMDARADVPTTVDGATCYQRLGVQKSAGA